MSGITSGDGYEILIGIIIVMLVILFIALAAAIIMYIISSIAQMRMLKKLGYDHPAFAWIPILSSYSLGWIAEQHDNGKPTRKYSKIYLVLQVVSIGMSIVTAIVSNVIGLFTELSGATDVDAMFNATFAQGIISFIVSSPVYVMGMVMSVFGYYLFYRTFQLFDPDKAVLYLVLIIFFPIAQPFIMIFASKKDPRNLRPTCPAYAKYNPAPYGYYDPAYAQYGQYQNPQYQNPQYGQQYDQQPPRQDHNDQNNQDPPDSTY